MKIIKLDESKRKKKVKGSLPFTSITYTTGDPVLNSQHFNKCMGTEYANGSGNDGSNGPDASLGLMGENLGKISAIRRKKYIEALKDALGKDEYLTEFKRYVRRYYIRPHNVFCSNKEEIIKALIKYEDKDCTIYTLNNLGDVKDVTKLTNNDIIYYYDDGILYDKNHVRVMDYDLAIKHEENRDKIDFNTASDATIEKVYADRLVTESAKQPKSEQDDFCLDFDNINAYGETLDEDLNEVNGVCCICGEEYEGYGNNAEPYAKGRCCDSCNYHWVLPARLEATFNKDSDNE